MEYIKNDGHPEHITMLMKYLYEGQEVTVQTHYGETEWFKVNKGIRQGCILSPSCLTYMVNKL